MVRREGGETPRAVAVDLTRLQPGGVNGGAKLMTVELVARMARLAPHWRFLLLTSAASHAELAALERRNVRRVCIQGRADQCRGARRTAWLDAVRTRRELAPLRWLYSRLFHRRRRLPLLSEERVDCLFLPLTAPLYYEPGIPSVAVVYDLQHVTYPEFFSLAERHFRNRFFRDCTRLADHVVCISDYARRTVQRWSRLADDRVSTIYIGLAERLPSVTALETAAVLDRWGLEPDEFFLYPANSWPHKNHLRLFEAFAQYAHRRGASAARLVCSGADTGRHDTLRRAVDRLGLADRVLLTGYLDDRALAALYAKCRAVVFPSLYEGFGMPVVEAMAAGKPVACSNATSLPEIAAGAALLFDPTDAQAIAAALVRLDEDQPFVAELVRCGRQRLASLPTADQMAQSYLDLFERVCGDSGRAARPLLNRNEAA